MQRKQFSLPLLLFPLQPVCRFVAQYKQISKRSFDPYESYGLQCPSRFVFFYIKFSSTFVEKFNNCIKGSMKSKDQFRHLPFFTSDIEENIGAIDFSCDDFTPLGLQRPTTNEASEAE